MGNITSVVWSIFQKSTPKPPSGAPFITFQREINLNTSRLCLLIAATDGTLSDLQKEIELAIYHQHIPRALEMGDGLDRTALDHARLKGNHLHIQLIEKYLSQPPQYYE